MGLNIRIAVLAAEDQRFWDHWGFDVIEIEDALDDLLDGRGRRGASSITQQTAKNLFLWKGQSFIRKGIEAYFTVLLEVLLPKRRILELYLNLAEFGPGLYGAEAASRVYFGKHSSQLSLREAALLAAVLPNPKKRTPNNLGPKAMQRVEWIEDQAVRTGNALARER